MTDALDWRYFFVLALCSAVAYAGARVNNVMAARHGEPPVAEPDELRVWTWGFLLALTALLASLVCQSP